MNKLEHIISAEGNITKPLIEVIKKYNIKVGSILDIGTRDMWQSIELHEAFPKSKSYAVEANRESYKDCVKNKPSYVNLFHFAALDYDGETSFYAVDQKVNHGASSVFEPTERVVGVDLFNGLKKTTVPCKRIDTWAKENKIDSIDVAWVDIQGVEVPALEGFGKLLDTVKVIATESETGELYHTSKRYEPTQYEQLKKYLEDKGFVEVSFDQPWPLECDIIYVRKTIVDSSN